jgi:hypothetical protein
VCDACFNVCVSAAEALASERADFERQRASAAAAARNMAAPPPREVSKRAELLGDRAPARAAPPAGSGALRAGDVHAALEDSKQKLALRGERLGRLDLKAQDMAASAHGFAAAADKLKQQRSNKIYLRLCAMKSGLDRA